MISKTIKPGTKVLHERDGIGIFKGWTGYGDAIIEFKDTMAARLRKDLTEMEDQSIKCVHCGVKTDQTSVNASKFHEHRWDNEKYLLCDSCHATFDLMVREFFGIDAHDSIDSV